MLHINTDDLFAQFPKGHSYNCNISYRQWNYSNDLLAEPLKVVNAFHNIVELENEAFEGQSSGHIHVIDISNVKNKLSLFVTNNPDREVVYNGDEPLINIKYIPNTVQWDFKFNKADVKIHRAGIMRKL